MLFFHFPLHDKNKTSPQINNRYSNGFQPALAALLFMHFLRLIRFQQMFLLHRENVFPNLT